MGELLKSPAIVLETASVCLETVCICAQSVGATVENFAIFDVLVHLSWKCCHQLTGSNLNIVKKYMN